MLVSSISRQIPASSSAAPLSPCILLCLYCFKLHDSPQSSCATPLGATLWLLWTMAVLLCGAANPKRHHKVGYHSHSHDVYWQCRVPIQYTRTCSAWSTIMRADHAGFTCLLMCWWCTYGLLPLACLQCCSKLRSFSSPQRVARCRKECIPAAW